MAASFLRPLTRAERKVLTAKLRRRSLSARVHQRYRVIAEVRAGRSARAAADRVGVTADTAASWVRRFNVSGFRTFEAVPNPRGRIPIITATQLRELVDTALSSPAELGLPFTSWSVRTLTEYCKAHHLIPEFSDEWVRRVLRREGLSAQRIRTWKTSDDPAFGPKGGASAPSTRPARRDRRSSASTSGARSSSGR
ncbi:MAG TPA: helix-turn-helix domain-containing protein [Gemmatimonadales bacterium]|nr:helix-turn-helix domain-containing protein [Gemmatimonadales bacterium]